ncbi:MAG: GxxExxY protein, partial [Acetobacteraceae bacterium]
MSIGTLALGDLAGRLALEVHRHTGSGLLEAVYRQCLCVELQRARIDFARQVTIPVLYKSEQVGDGFKA